MNKNIYYSDENSNSNFDGDWSELCQFCKKPHANHILEDHPDSEYRLRVPCKEHKKYMLTSHNNKIHLMKIIILIGWILIPLLIAILGFTNPVIGIILFVISIFKIGLCAIKLYGNPNKWILGHTTKSENNRKMKHYYYHCEKNPEAFKRLIADNSDLSVNDLNT